jgi:hypothetical protein
MRWFVVPLLALVPLAFWIGRATSNNGGSAEANEQVYTLRQGDVVHAPEAATR